MKAYSCMLVKMLKSDRKIILYLIRKGNPSFDEEADSLEPCRKFWLVWENLAY